VKGEPVLVCLFSTSDKEFIDRRYFDFESPGQLDGVIIENVETQLVEIISRGESVVCQCS
jgi:hypothetical protein